MISRGGVRSVVGLTMMAALFAGAPSAARAGSPPSDGVTCEVHPYDAPAQHEVGETELDATCRPLPGFENSKIFIDVNGAYPEATVVDNGTDHPSIFYTATTPTAAGGHNSYSFDVTSGPNNGYYPSYVNSVPATNNVPGCVAENAGAGPLAVGAERLVASCSDDEGETAPLTVAIAQQPSRGALRIDTSNPIAPKVYYRATCAGLDSYTYTVSDGVNTTPIYSAAVSNAGADSCSAAAPAIAAPPKATPPAVVPALTFSLKGVPSTLTADSSGVLTVPVGGTPGGQGEVIITATAPKGASASALLKRKKPKTLSIGSKKFKLPASGKSKVKVKASKSGFKALKKSKKLSGKVTVKGKTKSVAKATTLKAPKTKNTKKRG